MLAENINGLNHLPGYTKYLDISGNYAVWKIRFKPQRRVCGKLMNARSY
jgi:hypothetical protein